MKKLKIKIDLDQKIFVKNKKMLDEDLIKIAFNFNKFLIYARDLRCNKNINFI